MKIAGFWSRSKCHWDEFDTSVVFLQGCNFSCSFCPKASLIPIQKKEHGLHAHDLFHHLLEESPHSNRIVVAGGEPLSHGKALLSWLEQLKNSGFKIKLETNASYPNVLRTIVQEELVDLVHIQLKGALHETTLPERTAVTQGAATIMESIRLLRHERFPFEFSFTYIPTVHSVSELFELAQQVQGTQRFILQTLEYSTDFLDDRFERVKPLTVEQLRRMAESIQHWLPQIEIQHERKFIALENELPA